RKTTGRFSVPDQFGRLDHSRALHVAPPRSESLPTQRQHHSRRKLSEETHDPWFRPEHDCCSAHYSVGHTADDTAGTKTSAGAQSPGARDHTDQKISGDECTADIDQEKMKTTLPFVLLVFLASCAHTPRKESKTAAPSRTTAATYPP